MKTGWVFLPDEFYEVENWDELEKDEHLSTAGTLYHYYKRWTDGKLYLVGIQWPSHDKPIDLKTYLANTEKITKDEFQP